MLDFIRAVVGELPPTLGIEVRRLPGTSYIRKLDDLRTPEDLASSTYYFGVAPRDIITRSVSHASAVWCDVDDQPNAPILTWPPPTAVVASGGPGKHHYYWGLNSLVNVDDAVKLSLMACVAFKGDRAVVEPHRVMRIPGSRNDKYNPPVQCTLISTAPVRYGQESLQEHLLAAILLPHFTAGQRHQVALSLGALASRAGWPLQRALNVMELAYDQAPGRDRQGKLDAVRATYGRREQGQIVSSAFIRDLLGKDAWKDLLVALDISAHDGDIIIEGDIIGTLQHAERDLATYMMGIGHWASYDGRLATWQGTQWRTVDDPVLVSTAFGIVSRAKVIAKGEEREMTATVKLASAVSRVVTGNILKQALPDADPLDLPLMNGVLRVADRQLRGHDVANNNRWMIDYMYDPAATCPAWLAFLEEAASDAEVAAHLQEWAGYCMVGGNPWQRMLWLNGPTNTGKSTFIKVVASLLGPAASAVSADKLSEYTVAQLSGTRVAFCTELSPRTLKTTVFKALVAGDPVQARHPYGRPFTLKYGGKLLWGSNELPPVDQGEGMWRRIVPVPFTKYPRVVNERLEDTLRAERPGILNWALDGYDRLVGKSSWPLPAVVSEVVAQYKFAADVFARFVDEELMLDNVYVTSGMEIYQRYTSWCKERGTYVEPIGPRFFGELSRFGLQHEGYELIGGRRVSMWRGAKVVPMVFSVGGVPS